MANYDSALLRKNVRQRGLYGGKEQSVTGIIRLGIAGTDSAAAAVGTGDLLRMCYIGENVRPVRLVLTSTPVSGTPVVTNPTFNCGIQQVSAAAFTRGDQTVYPAPATLATALASGLTWTTDNMNTIIEVNRPVADSVPLYAPSIVTLTPTGALSVAGGAVDIALTVYFVGEQKTNGFVYTDYVNPKYKN